MISYLKSIFSLKKITHKAVSIFATWDSTTTFTKQSEIRRFSKLKGCSIGKYTRVNPGCKIANTTVGNFTAIGRDSSIGLGQHPTNYVSTQNIFYANSNMTNRWVRPIDFPQKSIRIGSDVWIGVEAMILDGVNVGDGAVVGARALVTKDVPPYAIVVGVPAKIIKYRFEKQVIDRLLDIKWWDLSEEEIDKNREFFSEKEVTLDVINRYF